MKLAFLCLSLGIAASSFAQENSPKRFKFNYVSIEVNGNTHSGNYLSNNFAQDLANMNSQVAKNLIDLDTLLNSSYPYYGHGFAYGYGFGYGGNSSGYSSLSIQLIDQKMQRFEGRLSLGIGTGNVQVGSAYRYFDATGRYDTLVSTQTGEMTFIDTTYRRSFYLNAFSQLTGMHVGYEIHTKNEKRFHFYTGANVSLNYAARMNVTAHDMIERGTNDYADYSGDSRYESFEIKKSYFSSQLNIPLGVEMKLGMKDNFWGNVNLRANLRGTANFNSSTYTGTNLYTSFGGGMGIVFRFP